MPITTVSPDPACLVTLIQNHWVAWLPELDSPIRLEAAELDVLGGARDADPEVLTGLLEKGVMQEGPANPTPRENLTRITDPGEVSLPSAWREQYSISHHLALEPTGEGFTAYSSLQRCYVAIPTSIVKALTEQGGKEEAETSSAAESLVQVLEEFGFLLPRDQGYTPAVRKNEAVAFARFAVGGVTQALRDTDTEADLAGRIPVYFTGCIDLAMDMSYGYLNLALGMLMASAKAYDNGRLNERYYLVPHFLMSPASVMEATDAYGPGIVFFSNYIWAHKGNLQAAAGLKEKDQRFLTVFGGPQAPTYDKVARNMLQENPHIDIIVRGEGEITAADLLDQLAWDEQRGFDPGSLQAVDGLIYLEPGSGELVRTRDRPRVMDLEELPSAYLEGVFDQVPRQILYGATLETNRGCPYGCTFCDWGSATRQKIRKFEMERVRAELEWIGKAGISVLFVADANFGVFKRDIEIAQMIADIAERYGSLKQVVTNYAKNATGTLTEIIRIFARAGLASEGIISIQTRDEDTLEVINRDNIKNRRYDELLDVFRSERLPLSTDLMIGLPGATTESFREDLQHYFENGVQVKAYLTRMLVNSPMADPDYRAEHEIETDERGFMRSCKSYNEQDRDYMLDLFGLFSLAVSYGLLKYVLAYLQWDKGIKAIDFVDALLREIKSNPRDYPRICWILGFLDTQLKSPGGWRPVLEEAMSFAEREFGVQRDSALESVLLAQEAVLADPDKAANRQYELEHDVVAYYRDGDNRQPLASYGNGKLSVRDPYGLCRMNPTLHYQYDTHSVAWELQSELNDVDRPVFFLEKDNLIASTAWPKRTPIGQRAW